MEHGGEADAGAKMARIGGDRDQCLGGGAEQDGIDGGLFWKAIAAIGPGSVKTTWK